MAIATVPDIDSLLTRVADGAAERERDSIDPREQVEMVRASGITALTLPQCLGGPGGSIVDLLSFIIDLAAADPIVAHIFRSHYLQIQLVRRLADEAARERWAKLILAGKIFGNATSERDGTLGTFDNAIRLVPDDDGWRLSGSKVYCTGTAYSDLVMVVVRLEEKTTARVNLPLGRQGITVLDDWDGIGQHRTGTGTTRFENVAVHEEDFLQVTLLDQPPVASDAPFMQLYLQAIMAGILRSVVRDATAILTGRTRTFDHAPSPVPAGDPVLLETVGRLASTAFATEALVLAAASAIDAAYASERVGAPDRRLFARAALCAAKAKVHIDDVALAAASALFDVGGASAASRAKNLDRHWRNIRTLTLHNPSSYKAIAIGDHVVNGSALPANGYF
jgi:alkylation response protein AidB-like acyl-CoA dehydrogenase